MLEDLGVCAYPPIVWSSRIVLIMEQLSSPKRVQQAHFERLADQFRAGMAKQRFQLMMYQRHLSRLIDHDHRVGRDIQPGAQGYQNLRSACSHSARYGFLGISSLLSVFVRLVHRLPLSHACVLTALDQEASAALLGCPMSASDDFWGQRITSLVQPWRASGVPR